MPGRGLTSSEAEKFMFQVFLVAAACVSIVFFGSGIIVGVYIQNN